MLIRDQMQADLTTAMKARDSLRMLVLRTTLSAVANAEAVEVPTTRHAKSVVGRSGDVARKQLSEADIRGVVAGERDALVSASEEMRGFAKPAEAENLSAQAAILSAYLG